LLASLHEHQRLQIQYYCDSDFKQELLRYQQETEKFSNVWTKRARNERFSRYWRAMSERKLRRQRVIFYVSRSLENVPKAFQTAAARREYYNTLLDQLETEFEHSHRLLLEIFGSGGARVLPMSVLDHFRHYKRFLNPFAQRPLRLRPGGWIRARTFDSGELLAQRGQRPVGFRFLPRRQLSLADCPDPLAAHDVSGNRPASHKPSPPGLHHHGQR